MGDNTAFVDGLRDMEVEDRLVFLSGEDVIERVRLKGPDYVRPHLRRVLEDLSRDCEDWAERVLDVAGIYAEEGLWWLTADTVNTVLRAYEAKSDAVSKEDALVALGLALEDPNLWERISSSDEVRAASDEAMTVPEDDSSANGAYAPDEERTTAYRTLARAAYDGDVESLSSLLRCFFEDGDEWPPTSGSSSVTAGTGSLGLPVLYAWIGDPLHQAWLGRHLSSEVFGREIQDCAQGWLRAAQLGGVDVAVAS